MKKRLLTGLLALCMLLTVLPMQVWATSELTEIRVRDTFTADYTVEDVDTGIIDSCALEVPEGGATVLILYSTGCGNCAAFFQKLNRASWVQDARIRIYAVDSIASSAEEIRRFRDANAPGLDGVVTWYREESAAMLSDCWLSCGMAPGSITWPVVLVMGQTGNDRYFRWIGDGITDVTALGETVQGMLSAEPEQPPEETTPEQPVQMVDLTVAGQANYDAAVGLVDQINTIRWENGAPMLSWNGELTELAMEWAAGAPLRDLGVLPDGTGLEEYLDAALPNRGDIYYWIETGDDSGFQIIEILTEDQVKLSALNQKAMTQIGVGCYQADGLCYWVVFLSGDMEQMEPVTKNGSEYRDYTFPSRIDSLPHFELIRFNAGLALDQTQITQVDVRAFNCIHQLPGILRPYEISRHIYDPETGVLIATAGDWKDGKITITGVAPGSGVLQVWAYEGQETPLSYPITVGDAQYGRMYNLTADVSGSGAVELSADIIGENKLVTVNIQPERRWELTDLELRVYDPDAPEGLYTVLSFSDVCWSEQVDGSYTFRMPGMNLQIWAEFSYIDEYPIVVNSDGNGEASASAPSAEPGETCRIMLWPQPGWKNGTLEWISEPEVWYWEGEWTIAFEMPEHPVELNVIFVEDPEATIGMIREGLYWYFDGVALNIYGEGAMDVPIDGNNGPWARFLDQIFILTIEEGITGICDYAFTGFPNVELVNIPASVTSIGREILRDFPGLYEIVIAGEPECHPDAFAGQEHLLENHYHDFTEEIVLPTCTEEGYTLLTCYCGQTGIANRIPALGHDYANGVCTRCGAHASGNPFTDVKDSDYFAQPVLWAVEQGITAGTSATTFAPNATCTRAQVVTFLWRAFGKPEPASEANPFTDVLPGDYFYKAVLWAVEEGITSGTGNGKFSPNNPCTRDQVVTFLWRAMGKPEPASNENPFADVPEGQWYYSPVLWAVENGITSGTSATTFAPSNPCTRGQVVTFLYRALKDK